MSEERSSNSSKMILIVEDDFDIGCFYRHLFHSRGFEVELATNGKEGLSKLASLKVDLILTDINMNQMDGNEFCKQVRLLNSSDAPIVAITGNPEQATASFARIIKKPFRIQELSETVISMLQKRTAVEEL